MGLTLHRMRENYKIAVYAGSLVPTYAPDSWLVLFRQRVSSWDVTTHAKLGTLVRELCFSCCRPSSVKGRWCREWRTLVLKPFLFYEIMCVILDWQRLFLIVGLCTRDPELLLFITVVNLGACTDMITATTLERIQSLCSKLEL